MLKTGESLMAALRASAGLGASDEAPRLADGRDHRVPSLAGSAPVSRQLSDQVVPDSIEDCGRL